MRIEFKEVTSLHILLERIVESTFKINERTLTYTALVPEQYQEDLTFWEGELYSYFDADEEYFLEGATPTRLADFLAFAEKTYNLYKSLEPYMIDDE